MESFAQTYAGTPISRPRTPGGRGLDGGVGAGAAAGGASRAAAMIAGADAANKAVTRAAYKAFTARGMNVSSGGGWGATSGTLDGRPLVQG